MKMTSLIHWPSRDALRLSMPPAFQKFFSRCAVILDCTEIFMERPTDLLARAQVSKQVVSYPGRFVPKWYQTS